MLVDFPRALPLLLSHSFILKNSIRVSLLTWCLEDPVLKFSIPLKIWDEYGDSSAHLLGGDYNMFHTTQRKAKKVCSSVIVSLLCWVYCFVQSASKISIDYHGNCIGPGEAIEMTDGKKFCIWSPYRIAHWILNSNECIGSSSGSGLSSKADRKPPPRIIPS